MKAIRQTVSLAFATSLLWGGSVLASERRTPPVSPVRPHLGVSVPATGGAAMLPAPLSAPPAALPSAPAPPRIAAASPPVLARVVPTAPRVVDRLSGLTALPAASEGAAYVTRAAVRTRAPKVTSRFGARVHPVTRVNHFHTGVDFRAPLGTTVGASMDGTVEFAGTRGGYGKLVVVDHGHGISTYYGHLSAIVAKPGQRVVAGEVIGRSGSSGTSTGPHLHYEVRRFDRPANPFGRIRIDAPAPSTARSPVGGDLAGAR